MNGGLEGHGLREPFILMRQAASNFSGIIRSEGVSGSNHSGAIPALLCQCHSSDLSEAWAGRIRGFWKSDQ